ncbi:S-(hydroxymethyl)glutathione dehydrogenase / alcohol dehydrogenase [Rhodococcus pyridinivorans]|uniref:NDMA-dependent alcohol dehydrogenase n=1 Tax=Rhodococcus pyridinivorans TaxID=103816 RepID=UPI0007CD6E6E|nr:NDMA-dependent alcohol dehydrogenase [Rhodococcus pyridinivorans]SEE11468.1 S-(hydroxymethyl)glutathione dehydrogenase / alcohol dehydrogenase [Rhodococcus pyridinivorans]
MKTQGAICWKPGAREGWSVEEIEIDDPQSTEVLVKLAASGLCHSDDHIDGPVYHEGLGPTLGGHEGAGVVEKVGSAVTHLKPGDHVVLAFIPACGRCAPCVDGHSNLCEMGQHNLTGVELSDLKPHIHARGVGIGTMCMLGTFSPYALVHEASAVKIRDDVPLEVAALVGCGVTTGWGSAVNAAQTQAGDTVVVIGVGGVGMNAVQGARMAGARRIIAVDTVSWKLEHAYQFGATHTASSIEEAYSLVNELTWGLMAEKVILTTGLAEGGIINAAMGLVGKRGTLVETAVAPASQTEVTLDLFTFGTYEKRLVGTLFGSSNARTAIPKLLDYYMDGTLKLDELVTNTYSLDEINEAYADMHAGKVIRGIIKYDL